VIGFADQNKARLRAKWLPNLSYMIPALRPPSGGYTDAFFYSVRRVESHLPSKRGSFLTGNRNVSRSRVGFSYICGWIGAKIHRKLLKTLGRRTWHNCCCTRSMKHGKTIPLERPAMKTRLLMTIGLAALWGFWGTGSPDHVWTE